MNGRARERPVRAIVYGVGAMGSIMSRLLWEKGATIVGAVARSPAKVGRDLGEVAGLGVETGVIVEADARRALAGGADVALVSVGSYLEAMFEHFKLCLEHGCNVVTIEEESFYPWGTAPERADELDRIGRANGATITGSGAQDVYWMSLPSVLMGAAHRIDEVAGRTTWNADDYGPEVAAHVHVGATPAQFAAYMSEHGWPSFVVRNVLDALMADTGLTMRSLSSRVDPVLAATPTPSRSLGITVEPGHLRGVVDSVTIRTNEGPSLAFEMAGHIYAEGECDVNEWFVRGDPKELHLRNDRVPTREITCTQVVNRIPDVINAEPGFATVDRLPKPRYRTHPLGHYVDDLLAPASRRVSLTSLSPISFLLRSAYVWADRPAVHFEQQTVTYAEFLESSEQVAGALRATGVSDGDRVATLLPNVPTMLYLHYAVAGIGASLVPLNPRLGRAELTYIVNHARPRVLVAHERLRQLLEEVLDGCDRPPETLYVDAPDGAEDSFEGRLGATPEPLAPQSEDALLSINYTSGTTGKPKGVMYSHRGAYLHALGVIAEASLSSRSRYLWTLPMFHCNGWAFTWAVTAAGAEHVCLDGIDPTEVWSCLRSGATHLCAAPTVLLMLAESGEASPLTSPVKAFVGGAPPSPAFLNRMTRLGLEITHLYGLTETYGPLCACAWQPAWDALPEDERAALQARQGVGTVVSERLRVVDSEMRDVPADGRTLGEVVMRGNNVMVGYYRDPEATAQAFAGGWFHSGDIAVMHPDGYLELRDRSKDIIISGGENISTIEVEQALTAHPDVVEAAVVGMPDERWGEVPKAIVVTRRGASSSEEQLQEFVRGRLARFKVPKKVEFHNDLPRTATGKIQKYLLR